MSKLTLRLLWHGESIASRLVRGSATALLITAAGQALTFGLQLLFTRELGVSEYGTYSYLVSWMSVGLILAKGGFDTALLRFVPAYSVKQLPDRVRDVIQTAVRQAGILGTLATIPICAGAWLIARTGGASFAAAVLITGLLIPIGACAELIAAGVRGLGQIARSLIGDMLVRPIVSGLVLAIAVAAGVVAGATQALGAYLVGTIASLFVSRHFLLRTLSWSSAGAAARLRGFWARSAALVMTANGFLILLYSLDVLMLGALDSVAASGLYNVASKLAVLVIFIMNAGQSVAGPMMARAYVNGRKAELQRVVSLFTLLSLLAALPIAAILAVGAPWLLRAFGPEFPQAADALFVLLGMQCVNVATGPVGLLLAMTGRQAVLAWLLLAAVIVNVILNVVLIPRFGLMGAAWSSFIAHGAWNIAGVVLIRRVLGVDCSLIAWLHSSGRGRM